MPRSVTGGGDGFKMKALGEGEEQDGALFKMGLGVVDEQMDCDQSGTNERTGEGADGAAYGRSGNDACSDSATVFNAVAFEARTGIDLTFVANARPGAGSSCHLRVEPVTGSIGQDDGVGTKAHGAVTAERSGGYVHDFAVDLRTGGDEHLAALEDIRGDAGVEDVAGQAIGGGEAVEQANTDDGPFAEFPRGQGRRMHDIAVRIVSGGAVVQGGLCGRVGSDLNDAVVGAVVGAVLRSGEGGTDTCLLLRGLGLSLVLVLDRRGLTVGRVGGGGLGLRSDDRGGGRSRRIAGNDGVVGRRTRGPLVGIGRSGLLRRR